MKTSQKSKALSKQLLGFIGFIMATWVLISSFANAPVHEQESASFSKLIIGKWKMVARDRVDSAGNVVESSEIQLLEFPGQEKDDNNEEEKEFEGWGITFNSGGEAFQEISQIGSAYAIKDSTLHMGGEWMIMELNDKKLQIRDISATELMDLGFGRDRITYERVNSVDLPSSNPLIKQLIVGEWESYEKMDVTVEGNALFIERERVIDTLKRSKEEALSLIVNEEALEFGPKEIDRKVKINYHVADSMIALTGGEFLFQILGVTQDSLSLLGPFDTSSRRMQLNFARKK